MKTLQHKFVEFIPENIEADTLYISIAYCTAIHLCVCGCGNEVVTPLSPTDWELTFNGKTVSLSPSIGNWSFDCKSHYWIIKNEINWSGKWNERKIEKGRKLSDKNKENFFNKEKVKIPVKVAPEILTNRPKPGWWKSLLSSIGIN